MGNYEVENIFLGVFGEICRETRRILNNLPEFRLYFSILLRKIESFGQIQMRNARKQ